MPGHASAMSDIARTDAAPDPRRRAFWLKTLHQWHWISSALCLVGMLLFSVTGITLNHAGRIGATPSVTTRTASVPAALLDGLRAVQVPDAGRGPLPTELRRWLDTEWQVGALDGDAEWLDEEIYMALPRPGGDAWFSIDTGTGEATYEVTTRGWLAYANDLHKGRNTGPMWAWFIDLFAVACVVFTITGLFLRYLHGRQRAMTWPMVGLGLVIPLLIVLLFIH
jgi:hypothetical protein